MTTTTPSSTTTPTRLNYIPTQINSCVGFNKLAAGWSFYSPSGSKFSFAYIFGELQIIADFADHADLIQRTFVVYEDMQKVSHLRFIGQLQTPDGLSYFIYEQLWCLIGKTRSQSLEASFAAS